MSVTQNQLARLQKAFPGAELIPQSNGTTVVKVPDVPLPQGKWNGATTTIYFVAPVGYPMAPPDCFWADPNLRLSNGSIPQNTGEQTPPFGGEPKLWFSWHVSSWSPNRSDLLTYMRLIQERLNRAA